MQANLKKDQKCRPIEERVEMKEKNYNIIMINNGTFAHNCSGTNNTHEYTYVCDCNSCILMF